MWRSPGANRIQGGLGCLTMEDTQEFRHVKSSEAASVTVISTWLHTRTEELIWYTVISLWGPKRIPGKVRPLHTPFC